MCALDQNGFLSVSRILQGEVTTGFPPLYSWKKNAWASNIAVPQPCRALLTFEYEGNHPMNISYVFYFEF